MALPSGGRERPGRLGGDRSEAGSRVAGLTTVAPDLLQRIDGSRVLVPDPKLLDHLPGSPRPAARHG